MFELQIYQTLCFCFHGNHGHYTTNDYFLYVLDKVSLEQIQTSIIHLAPCSQEIIDNENSIFLRFFFGRCEFRLFGCHDNNNCFSFHGIHGHYLNVHCYQFKIWHLFMKSVIWKSLWPKENFMILAWYEMHLKCFIFASIETIHIN